MKKRALSLFMAFVLCLTLLPTAVLAVEDDVSAQSAEVTALSIENADEGGHADHKYCGSVECSHAEGSITNVAPIATAEELLKAGSGNYYLSGNIELSCTWSPADNTVLCLNGNQLALKNATGAVIHVEKDRTFTLLDCGAGTITHRGSAGGQGVLADGKFYMYGGTITQNWADESRNEYAGGVYVSGTGSFYMLGGTITRNNFTDSNPNNPSSAGVLVATGGRITLSRDADISDNGTSDDLYLCNDVKIAIGADGLSGNNRFYVRLQYCPAYRSGKTVEITYKTDTDVSAHFRSADTSCITNDRPSDHVVLLTAKLTSATTDLTATVDPATLALPVGTSGTLTMEANAKTGYSFAYQWYQNTQDSIYGGGTAIDGETGTTFQVPSTLAAGTYYYYCTVSLYNSDGGIVQQENAKAVVKVLDTLTIRRVEDVTQPYGTEGGKVGLNITGADGYTLSYQWYEMTDPNEISSSKLISGATGAEYPIPTDTPIGEYYYYCKVHAAETNANFTTNTTKVTITKAKQSDVLVSVPVYFNTETMYTYDLKDYLPEGQVLSNASYKIDGNVYCNSGWIDGGVQLAADGTLTFRSKSANDPNADIVLELNITVKSDNYGDFTIQLTGRATPKLERELATKEVRWTYGDTPKDPKDSVTKAPSDAVWVRTTYMDLSGNVIEAPTNAGDYKFMVEYESVNTHYTAKGDLKIEPIVVDKSWVKINNTSTTYNGTTQEPRRFIQVTVTANGKTYGPLVADKDFWVSGIQAAADVSQTGRRGVLTLKGNYRTVGDEPVDFTWTIAPLEAELELANADNRRYGDGKGAVTMQVKNAYERDGLTLTYDGGTDLSVGDHNVTALALSGAGAGNYTLPAAKTLSYHVAKGDAGDPRHLTMDVYNNTARTYIYDFTKALPELGEGLTLGNYSYSGKLSGYESEYWINESNVHFRADTGVLTFTTGKRTSSSDNFILCYVVTVQSDNYNDFKLILSAYPKNKDEVPLPEGTVSITSWSYGSEPNEPVIGTIPTGAQLVSTVYKNAAGDVITPSSTMDAGSYTVTLRYETDDTAYIGTANFTVHPRHVTWENFAAPAGGTLDKVYDGTTDSALAELSIESGMLVTTADAALRVGGTAEYASPNAGQTKLFFTPDKTIRLSDPSSNAKPSNYAVNSPRAAEFSATIQQRPLAFTVDSANKPFGSSNGDADVRVTFTDVAGNNESGLVNGETLEQGVDYDVSATFSRTDIGTDGSVTVTVTLKDTVKAKNYKLTNATLTGVTGTITKAAAPAVPEQTAEIYSNAATSYTIDLAKRWPAGAPAISDYAQPNPDDAEVPTSISTYLRGFNIPAQWTGTLEMELEAFDAEVGTDLGVIEFVLKSANYEDVTIPVRVKVKAKAQETLNVSLEGWTYGETANPPAYSVPTGVTKTTLTYTSRDGQTSYGSTPPTGAGDYTLTVRCEGIDTIWIGSADFTIAPAALTVTALDKRITAGQPAPDLTTPVLNEDYKVNGLLGQDALTAVTLTYNETPDTSKAGSYAINISAVQANYDITTVPGTLTIAPRPSSGGGSTTYPVNTPSKTENGSVSVSPKNASRGDTVTITVKPDSGYELETITATDKNGNDLKLTDKGDGKYSFVMPAGKVEIMATFMEDNSLLNFFYDVPNDAYYYEAVKWAVGKGITEGVGNNLFAPDRTCTRAQIVTFLWRAAGSPEPKAMGSFSDVPADSYYAKAVTWAVENGITTGTSTDTFSPDATCTRAQAVTFLARALNAKASGKAEFADVPVDSYFAEAVAWAASSGVTEGVGNGLFAPDNNCTRGQIVTFLWRAYNR